MWVIKKGKQCECLMSGVTVGKELSRLQNSASKTLDCTQANLHMRKVWLIFITPRLRRTVHPTFIHIKQSLNEMLFAQNFTK